MSDPAAALRAHTAQHEFLICIDSDGCAFDTMELKHKECFIPNTIKYWDLQPVSKYARMAAEFVNLYSQQRGVNRFPAMTATLDLLAEWDKVQARGVKIPAAAALREWIRTESKLGNPALERACAAQPDAEDLQRALAWSKAVNKSVADIVGGGLPPFPHVRESLEKAGAHADLMVCSATPQEALVEEWRTQRMDGLVFTICGQEQGSKAEHIQLAGEGRYEKTRILMIGDAPGDHKAARKNGALFYPINPGDEDRSWERFYREALDRFFEGAYSGAYEAALIAEFDRYLPATPPWKI